MPLNVIYLKYDCIAIEYYSWNYSPVRCLTFREVFRPAGSHLRRRCYHHGYYSTHHYPLLRKRICHNFHLSWLYCRFQRTVSCDTILFRVGKRISNRLHLKAYLLLFNAHLLMYINKCRCNMHFIPILFLCYKTYSYICIGKKKN